jgi:crotonobetainyl-CoA:carnitine CoA-transferase CaiB-like acyl-CoA transferase
MSPLSGVRVLDMSRLLPGPFCTQLLCDLGAEVIKVEDPEGGDYARSYPPLLGDGNSAAFHALNRGKKSVTLDLKRAEDWRRFLALLATADVLVESFRPGVLAKLGAGPSALAARFPGLIVCSISGYGQTGPDALRAGHDVNYLAKSGVLGLMARPELLPVQVADIAGGR